MDEISTLIAARGGAGLFIDYGHTQPGIGDTLQAVRAHAYDDLLAHPGEADITSHVDFAALAATARSNGLQAHTVEQGAFLLAMGLLERAGSLGSGKNPGEQERLRAEVERL